MKKQNIIPSDKLIVVSNHKLADMCCWRKYFYKQVLNLESVQLYHPFWAGGVLGAGIEALLSGKNWKKAVQAEDKKRLRRHYVSDEDKPELELKRRLIESYITHAGRHPEFKRMRIEQSQVKLSFKLQCGLLFQSSLDGLGTYMNEPALFEFKYYKIVTNDVLATLPMDTQICSYGANCRANKIKVPKCCYCIFRKPSKWVKRNQSIDGFIREMNEDLADRRDFYFYVEHFSLGRNAVDEGLADIESKAAILKDRFSKLKRTGHLYDITAWPRNMSECGKFRGCEFLKLCKHQSTWEMYLRYYQQREMLYKEESEELAQ